MENAKRPHILSDVNSDREVFTENCRKEGEFCQKYLKEEDAIFVSGYDYAAERAMENLFNNLEHFSETLEAVRLDPYGIDDDVLTSDKTVSDYDQYELRDMSRETRVFLAVRDILKAFMEEERNEMIGTLLKLTYKKMSEEEKTAWQKAADAGSYRNIFYQ